MSVYAPMRSIALFLLVSGCLPAADTAHDRIKAALDAMGGEKAIRAVKTVRFESIGYRNMLEQSERPEGPWLKMYQQTTEIRDLEGRRIWRRNSNLLFQNQKWSDPVMGIVTPDAAALKGGDRWNPGSASDIQAAEEQLALSPERLLITALESTDLRAEADAILQGVNNKVLSFTWTGHRVRMMLNAYTNLPTAVDLTSSYPTDFYWNVWGDVTTRTLFSLWDLQKGWVRYPRQWDIERNGQQYRSVTLTVLEMNGTLAPDQFEIPEETRKAFAARTQPKVDDTPLGQPGDIASGIVQFRGAWNIALVRQDDGVVILETVISSGHAAKAIDEGQQRFPGAPIKAAISTSDSWPHASGIREYVARGIPVFILDLNQPILDRMVKAPHTATPDRLAKKPQAPKWRVVARRTTVGSGPNRLELIPARTESGERMMLAWFPEHQLLYASDLIQRSGRSFFMPEYLLEVKEVTERERIQPKTVFAMHLAPTPWADVTAAIDAAVKP
jgi:hypothetical protein